MKNKYNNLLRYIYDYSEKTQRKETVNGLFRAILEPLIQNQKAEACVLLRIFDIENKDASLKRLTFSGVEIYNFGNKYKEFNSMECEAENIWNNTEFLVVLGGRYSAALIWDYSESREKNNTPVCLLYNSKIILDIAKVISDNSKENSKEKLNDLLKKYSPDRRENIILNKSIQTIASMLNDKNEEILFSSSEKNRLEKDDDLINKANIISEKAKFISHEIKNHLSIINLYSKIANKRFETLTGQDDIISSIENSLNNIINASENISYLISDLRCMSTPFKSEIKLISLIEQATELCKIRVEKSNAKIIIEHIEDKIITTDKVKVQCAITNIIFNALDAGAKTVSINAAEHKITIKNDGEKITDEVKNHIFEENFTTKEQGNGLGLAFCKKQMQLTGGDIVLDYSDNNETVFQIII